MNRALILGASGGIGQALAAVAADRGAEVVTLSRRDDGFDVTDAATVAAALDALDPPFDLIVVATGILAPVDHGPEKALKQIDPAAMARTFAVNTIGPALILKHAPRLMPRDARAVAAILSARVGSIGDNRLGGWYSYRASKAAVNQIVHSAAVELARTHPHAVVAALHPGTVATPFTAAHVKAEDATPPAKAAANLLDVCARLTAEDSGSFHDYAGKPIPW